MGLILLFLLLFFYIEITILVGRGVFFKLKEKGNHGVQWQMGNFEGNLKK